MEEKAVLNNLRRSFSAVNNNCNNNNYLYGGGMKLQLKSHHNWCQSQLYANAMLGSYQFYEAPRLCSSLPQPPLLPLPLSSNYSNAALPLLPMKKKIKPSSKNNIKKKKKITKKPACFPKPTTKELAAAAAADYKEEEEEEEEFFLSPPPSSLPLPRLLLTSVRPKATSCFAEPDTGGATNDLRRLLRL